MPPPHSRRDNVRSIEHECMEEGLVSLPLVSARLDVGILDTIFIARHGEMGNMSSLLYALVVDVTCCARRNFVVKQGMDE